MLQLNATEFFAVGLFAYLGVFIRIELSAALTRYAADSIGPFSLVFVSQPYLISNVLGCFLIAILVVNKDHISKFSVSGYTGLTSGLCGCLTTFSSWMVTNFDPLFTKQNIGYLILSLIVQFSLTWSALTFGFYVARFWTSVSKVKSNDVEMQPVSRDDVEEPEQGNLDVCISGDGSADLAAAVDGAAGNNDANLSKEGWMWLILFVCTTLALVVSLMVIKLEHNRDAVGLNRLTVDRLKALVLAPPGAWLRWGLSKTKLKEMWPELHLHTLTANLSAVLIASCLTHFDPCYTWRHSLVAGFCGSLSTVSTLFSELHKLHSEKGPLQVAKYLLITFIPAVSIVQMILQIRQDTE